MRIAAAILLALTLSLQASPVSLAQTDVSGGMLRNPDISAEHIVFSYGDDLWVVSREGGIASPLASPAGSEQLPRFNEDGTKIAFVGNYEGNSDIYEIPVAGGIARRVTYHPGGELLCDYGPGGELVFSTSSFAKLGRMQQLFSVADDQPIPSQLPVPYGTNASINDSGEWLAYTPYSRDSRTWKRYRGGMASDVWLFNLKDHSSIQMTDWEGTDSFPMWHGETVYYLSDAGPAHRMNIWKYDVDSEEHSQVTKFKKLDVKTPAIGPGPDGDGEIVFQLGAQLRVLDLESAKSRVVKVQIPGDRPSLRPKQVDASDFIRGASLSPSAKRVAVEARGDIWTLPAKNGSPRNLTPGSESAERSPSWSPDGKWVAYFSDASGEYQLYVVQSDGTEEPKQLTDEGKSFRFNPAWSPDSKKIYYYDQTGSLFVHDLDTEETVEFDQEPYANGASFSWSHDSNWLAYTCSHKNVPRTQIKVLHVPSGEVKAISSGYFNDSDPAFDRKGDFLYYRSSRDFSSPSYEDVGTTFIYDNTEVLVAVPLRADFEHPLASTSDEETWKDESEEEAGTDEEAKEEEAKGKDKGDDKESADKKDDSSQEKGGKKKRRNKKSGKGKSKKADADKKSDAAAKAESKDDDEDSAEDDDKGLKIDFDGIEQRSFRIPVSAGNFRGLAVADAGLMYARLSSRGESGPPSIVLVKMENGSAKEETVLKEAAGFELTPDGKKMLVSSRGGMYIVNAAPNQSLKDKVPTAGMQIEIDRRAEWKQIFNDAWRMERDFFYDPTMHGVNWERVKKQYEKMLDDCVSRRDLSFLIREMISELNVGHAYYREGDVESGPRQAAGLLGCSFEQDDDVVRIGSLWQGGIWDTNARNPLAVAGVQESDALLEVEGVKVDTSTSPYRHFIGKVGRSVRLKVQTGDDEPRIVTVKPISSDSNLRFWAGIEAARAHVEKESDGAVGYIYVTNTSINGQNDLFRQFYSQQEKKALIIDDRWNGGGQIPTRFIELLNRPVTNYWARRDGTDWVWPPDSHQGPKCMLINGLAGSGGDMFPALFKQAGLGKLIGRRTWGGLVGITGYPAMVDGSSVTAPSFAYYENDGTWGIEGHGVDPDLEVIDDPAEMADGQDPQLDAAIEQMLKEIKDYPERPKRPAYPDRSRMGLPDSDK